MWKFLILFICIVNICNAKLPQRSDLDAAFNKLNKEITSKSNFFDKKMSFYHFEKKLKNKFKTEKKINKSVVQISSVLTGLEIVDLTLLSKENCQKKILKLKASFDPGSEIKRLTPSILRLKDSLALLCR